MTNPAAKTEAGQEKNAILTYGGMTLKASGDGILHILDVDGNEITGVEERIAIIEQVFQAFTGFGVALQNEAAKRQQESKVIATMSSMATAAVGYVTKASKGLPFPVQYAGLVKDREGNVYKDENGDVLHLYTTVNPVLEPILEHVNHYKSEIYFKMINDEGKFSAAGFGLAAFPTSKRGKTGTDMLQTLFENKKELGIKANWIHGEACFDNRSYFLDCDDGDQYDYYKNSTAAAFPVWSLKHPII